MAADVDASGVLALVARMRRELYSRNRNFEAFAEAKGDGARARRLFRFLRSVERDVREAGKERDAIAVRIDQVAEGRRITIEVPRIRLRRVATLSAAEYDLLREDGQTRAVLDRAESPG